ncbi:MAG: hypothetical protein KBE19_03470 [Rhodocyclaceae bacterium]|nr:hypothetical protein [Rhodocyclaceae bacterium]
MDAGAKHRFVRRLCAGIAVAFGAVTLFAGGRVLLGADPGYTVFRPLLVFNTAMGAAYAAAGAAIWRDLAWGRNCAGAIFLLNLLALAAIAAVHFGGGAVAAQSLGAMSLRTVVWLLLFLVLARLARKGSAR